MVSPISPSFVVLVPTLLVIITAALFHHVRIALLVGVISAALVASHGQILPSGMIILRSFYHAILTDTARLYSFGFLIFLGIFINLLTHSGGIRAYAERILHYLKTPRAAQITTLGLAPLFFLDEYFSNLTLGCIMNPIFDFFGATRVKLAYLLNAVGATTCVLVPASSWTAFLVLSLERSGIHTKTGAAISIAPFFLYCAIIPFMLYPILSIFSAWFITLTGISFGPMKKFERALHTPRPSVTCERDTVTSNAATSDTLTRETHAGETRMYDTPVCEKKDTDSTKNFFIPFALFVGCLITLFAYTGYTNSAPSERNILTILQKAEPLFSLFFASLFACIVSAGMFLWQKIFGLRDVAAQVKRGVVEMFPAVLVLTLAWTFGYILEQYLHTGSYVAQSVLTNVPLWLLPLILFVVALIISASTGSAWGTLTILIPLAVPLITQAATAPITLASVPLILPIFGSIISGSVAGGHFSPFHDLVVLASTSTKIQIFDQLKTQIAYSIPAVIGTATGLTIASLLLSYTASIGIAIGLSIASGIAVTTVITCALAL